MSGARSLTGLSDSDYEAIEAAVMETARGRWFLSEYAGRNRHADTAQILGAIGRLERALTTEPASPARTGADTLEAAALIADLRIDLERISGRHDEVRSGLAARIEASSSQILTATEALQEIAWKLREAGANVADCDALDRRTAEIYTAALSVEDTTVQIGKIADTIVMLDSSLRAFEPQGGQVDLDLAHDLDFQPPAPSRQVALQIEALPPAQPMSEIEFVEIQDAPGSGEGEGVDLAVSTKLEPICETLPTVGNDLALVGPEDEDYRPAALAAAGDLREIDALPPGRKLTYFV